MADIGGLTGTAAHAHDSKQGNDSEGRGGSSYGAGRVRLFLLGKLPLNDEVLVALHQTFANPILVARIIRASQGGAKLGSTIDGSGKTPHQLVRDPAFDWGSGAAPEAGAEPAAASATHAAITPGDKASEGASPDAGGKSGSDGKAAGDGKAGASTAGAAGGTGAGATTGAGAAATDLRTDLDNALKSRGSDEAGMIQAVERAPLDQVTAVAKDATLIGRIDAELSAASGNKLRGALAHRLAATDAESAFALLESPQDNVHVARLAAYGSVAEQRALADAVIQRSTNGARVKLAFHDYWGVECNAVSGATTWPVPVLQAIHRQMKLIPDQDTRSGVWKKLSLTSDPNLIDRAAWDGSALIVGSHADTTSRISMGYATRMAKAAAAKATTVEVLEGARLAVNDKIAIGSGPTKDTATIKAIAGNTWTIEPALKHAHGASENVAPDDGSAERAVNWLDATVRHEIGHSVETALGGVTGYTVGLGGWWTGGDFDTWAKAMGDPWKTNDGTTIAAADQAKIKAGIVDHVKNQSGSLLAPGTFPADHPINKYKAKQVPVIVAAEACLSRGDSFYDSPTSFYGAGGKRFSVSFWYRTFMYHKEEVLNQRVSNYSLYAPAEFFAESYTTFYEEAGRTGITDADYGRLIRNTTWRSWIRTNIHERGHAPAGTGASKSGPGAKAGGAAFGKHSGNPG